MTVCTLEMPLHWTVLALLVALSLGWMWAGYAIGWSVATWRGNRRSGGPERL